MLCPAYCDLEVGDSGELGEGYCDNWLDGTKLATKCNRQYDSVIGSDGVTGTQGY